MRLYDGEKIIIGLIIFVGLVTYPLLHNTVSGKSTYAPKLETPKDKKDCIEAKEYIRVNHKSILEDWRLSVVRNGLRVYQASNKKRYQMSLNRTCMECHSDKTKFCDQCHNYMGVTNKCWNCHIYPKQIELGKR